MKVITFESILFSLLMSIIMSGAMPLAFLVGQVQTLEAFLPVWLEQWAISLVVAIPVGLVSTVLIGQLFKTGKRFFANLN